MEEWIPEIGRIVGTGVSSGAAAAVALYGFRRSDKRAEKQDLSRRIDNMSGRIDSTRTELSERIEQTNSRIDSTRTDLLDRIDSTRTELSGKLDELLRNQR